MTYPGGTGSPPQDHPPAAACGEAASAALAVVTDVPVRTAANIATVPTIAANLAQRTAVAVRIRSRKRLFTSRPFRTGSRARPRRPRAPGSGTGGTVLGSGDRQCCCGKTCNHGCPKTDAELVGSGTDHEQAGRSPAAGVRGQPSRARLPGPGDPESGAGDVALVDEAQAGPGATEGVAHAITAFVAQVLTREECGETVAGVLRQREAVGFGQALDAHPAAAGAHTVRITSVQCAPPMSVVRAR